MDREKLKTIRMKSRLSQNEFAKMFDIKQQTYARWELGQAAMPADFLYSLVNVLKVRPEYIFYNQEPVFQWENNPSVKPPPGLETLARPIAHRDDNEIIYIPVINANESDRPYIDLIALLMVFIKPYDPSLVKAARMVGDAMEKELQNGDIVVFVDELRENSGMYVCQTRWGITVRLLTFRLDGSIEVAPANPEHPKEIVTKEGEHFKVCGKVITQIKRTI